MKSSRQNDEIYNSIKNEVIFNAKRSATKK